jgi:uncharacterized NAD(P)/FAD-binding protein YdhS
MDILHLVDRLEELLNTSRPFPFTRNVIVDEEKILDIIDQMRVAVPEEIKKAQEVLANKERVSAKAQEEANRTLAIAREKSDQLLERDAIVMAAQNKADAVMQAANAEAERVRTEADQYVVDTLSHLEVELDRYINQVRNGIRAVKKEQP